MSVHVSEATVDPQERVILDHLPFQPGEKVDVVIHSRKSNSRSDLKDSVVRYDAPLEPVALEDWEGKSSSLASSSPVRRVLGWARGEFGIPDDFNALLPVEIEDAFYR